MTHSFLTVGAALLLLTACVQRAPTLPDLPQDQRPVVEKAKDWEDWGPEQNKKKREAALEGNRLTTEQITAAFKGRVLRGCYPNGEAFAETLAEDGQFYDAMNNNQRLGTWAARNAQLCFRYPERAQQGQSDACFAVLKAGSRYDFYSPDLSQKVASTACPR